MTSTSQSWMPPESFREGDDFIYVWKTLAVVVKITSLYEDSHRELHGEIRCDLIDPATAREIDHLHWQSLNLSAQLSRSNLIKEMNTREGHLLDWQRGIRFACTDAAFRFREALPMRYLSEVVLEAVPEDLVLGVIPFGQTSTIYGDGADSKSLTALAIAMAVQTGGRVGPFQASRQSNVLMLDWEASEEEQTERMRKIAAGLGVEHMRIAHQVLSRRITDEMPLIRQRISQGHIGFVIVDSLMPAAGGEGPDNQIIPVFNALRSLTGCTRTLLTHITKGDREKDNDSPYGSVYVSNLSRAVWRIKRVSDEGNRIIAGMFCKKRNRGPKYPPIGLQYDFDDERGVTRLTRVDPLSDPQLARQAPLSMQIRQLLLHRPRLTIVQIATELDKSEGAVSGTISRMRDAQGARPLSGVGDGKAYLYSIRSEATPT